MLFDVPDPILPAIDRKPSVKVNGFVNRISIKRGPNRKAEVMFISVLRIKFHADMDQARFKPGDGFLDTGFEGLANLGTFGIFRDKILESINIQGVFQVAIAFRRHVDVASCVQKVFNIPQDRLADDDDIVGLSANLSEAGIEIQSVKDR